MGVFWEFFAFELRFRIKSISLYVYFLTCFAFSFLSVASESFAPGGEYQRQGSTQRAVLQFFEARLEICLPGRARWSGSFVTTVFAFSGMLGGTYFGTFALG